MSREFPLHSISIDVESFAPFGQVIMPGEDGVPFGPDDAQLVLSNGRGSTSCGSTRRPRLRPDHAPCPRRAMRRGNGRAGMTAGRGVAARARRSVGDA
jgi:hypothetical protein